MTTRKDKLSLAIEVAAQAKAFLLYIQRSQRPLFASRKSEEFCGYYLAKGEACVEPVMLAFATELCLKAWAIRYGPDDMKFATHKLDKLFALLPDEIRQKLKHGYEVKYGRRDCPIFGNWEMDLESALEADRDAFVHWRYLYEHDGAKFSTTRSMDIIEFLLDEFFKTIHVRKLSANPLG